jgi:N-acetylmuramoyl-L-alanine amidase
MKILITPILCFAAFALAPANIPKCFKYVDHPPPVDIISANHKKQIHCLAVTIYGEARSESEKGQIAVGYSALNRAKNKTVCKVVLRPKQYSVFNNNDYLRRVAMDVSKEPNQKNDIDKVSWNKAKEIAALVMNRKVQDPTHGSTHYIADKIMKKMHYRYPKWTKEFKQVAVIGDHRFFVSNKDITIAAN